MPLAQNRSRSFTLGTRLKATTINELKKTDLQEQEALNIFAWRRCTRADDGPRC